MKKYEKPVVMINEELAEGVYAASGCYEVRIAGHQVPEESRKTHKFQFDGSHLAYLSDGHCGSGQVLVVQFDKPVDYVKSSGAYLSGTGTETIRISYEYTQNAQDNIGLGDLEVVSTIAWTDDLEIVALALECNRIKNW